MLIVYHYTNKEGLAAIQRSGYIKESTDTGRDATYGKGVYLTSLSPDYDKIKVAKACWGPASKSAIEKGKLDYAIRIEIPRKDPTPPKETVFRYIGQLDLRDYTHEFLKCNWRNDNNDGIVIGLVTGLVGAIAVLGVAVVKAIL